MKKNLFFTSIAIAFIAILSVSCAESEECKTCKAVTYEKETDGSWSEISSGNSTEYCEDELTKIEDEEPVIVGDEKTEWVCE